MADNKDLIRYKPNQAVDLAKRDIINLTTKYLATDKADTITPEEHYQDSILLKWASKALLFITGEDTLCNHLLPCIDLMISHLKTEQSLVNVQAKQVLLYAKSRTLLDGFMDTKSYNEVIE